MGNVRENCLQLAQQGYGLDEGELGMSICVCTCAGERAGGAEMSKLRGWADHWQ